MVVQCGGLVRHAFVRLTTEKECYKWADQLWDEWFEEAYAESKAGMHVPILYA